VGLCGGRVIWEIKAAGVELWRAFSRLALLLFGVGADMDDLADQIAHQAGQSSPAKASAIYSRSLGYFGLP